MKLNISILICFIIFAVLNSTSGLNETEDPDDISTNSSTEPSINLSTAEPSITGITGKKISIFGF